MTLPRLQRTLARPAKVSGRGYWTGREARVELRPAGPNRGITFVRDDLAAGDSAPRTTIQATVAMRRPTARRTVLGGGGGDAEVAMTEHVLAALAGLGIDNCEVGIDAPETPGCDGSAAAFVEAIDAAGIVEQPAVSAPLVVRRPIRCGDERSWIEAWPPIGGGLSIEYRLDYGAGSSIGRQWLVVDMTEDAFRYEIAPARTFLLESEAAALVAQGLGGHVTASELLIFRDDPQTEADRDPIGNTLRFADECVRHKILDVVGDLCLAGRPVVGHIVASCSGHRLNADLVELLLASHPQNESEARRRSA